MNTTPLRLYFECEECDFGDSAAEPPESLAEIGSPLCPECDTEMEYKGWGTG